ncbi:DnaB-like helicase C-terminal domain-containing protein [Nocardia altamirensis]|uniref:DnaB-like helicase C-terminal domain-containing protein n=1 Tax=Nocardia altamirensis TaxID=472158 RepID=UPI000B2831F8|nr:DnaB-like helicase C-terminal domain-containing protein [Nocardia altamirensis]
MLRYNERVSASSEPTQPPADDTADEARAPVDDALADTFEGADGTFLEGLLQPTIDDIDARAVAGGPPAPGSVPTGFTEFDELTGGLARGTLTVIAGHPGVGCSTLALNIAAFAAISRGMPTACLVLDSAPTAVTRRLLAAEAKINYHDIQTGRMTDDDWTKLARRMSEISEAPIAITRPKNRDITAVKRFLSNLIDQFEIELIMIDSLHLLTARQEPPYENREREIGEITRQLKVFALDTNTAIVVTSQMSTNPGPRQPFPVATSLADLRDSGSIAHIADYVLFLERPDAWEPDHPRGGEADLRLAKNRHGPTVTFLLEHQLHLARFREPTP